MPNEGNMICAWVRGTYGKAGKNRLFVVVAHT